MLRHQITRVQEKSFCLGQHELIITKCKCSTVKIIFVIKNCVPLKGKYTADAVNSCIRFKNNFTLRFALGYVHLNLRETKFRQCYTYYIVEILHQGNLDEIN